MKYLDTITDKTIFSEPEFSDRETYINRVTVKAIVKNAENNIALITNDVHHLYTLPGGGAESENLLEEISRECIEEINCDILEAQELARVKELRNREGIEYETVCFVGTMGQVFDTDSRTDDEKNNNLRVEWLSVQMASDIFKKQKEMLERGEIGFYNTAFNVYRDSLFWDEFVSRSN